MEPNMIDTNTEWGGRYPFAIPKHLVNAVDKDGDRLLQTLVGCEELRKESFKLGNDVGELGCYLQEEVIDFALRNTFPSIGGTTE